MKLPWESDYAQVPGGEKGDEEQQGQERSDISRPRPSTSRRVWPLLEHAALIVVTLWLISTFWYPRVTYQISGNKRLPSEIPFAEDVIEYEERTFDPSGFWEDETMKTPWEGPMTPEREHQWRNIVGVGNMALNKQEIDAIGLDTMKVPGETDKWFVTIEMFHQLHCLHYLRRTIDGHQPNPPDSKIGHQHLDHCIDYLRQVLMCHGDLTPITMGWDEQIDSWKPNFRIKHTCRKFDKIYDFALKYNTTGSDIEAAHVD